MKSREETLLKLISNHDVTFYIPPYQRNYEWTTEQCEVFLNDVLRTQKSNSEGTNAEHFFGTIIYFESKGVFGRPTELVLIDGQQRITTIMLFLTALRDILGEQNGGKFIDTTYLKNNNADGDDEQKVKLKQVETDWDAYKNLVLSAELSETEKKSAVYRNYKYFYFKLAERQANGFELVDLIQNGLERFSAVTIQLQPDENAWENPQEIFESMNSLGKPLSLADLVRNFLLLGLEPQVQQELYSQFWTPIEKVVPGRLSDYIRDYMQYRESESFPKSKESNYKELYGLFKKIFATEDARTLLTDLSQCSTIYSWLLPGGSCGKEEIDRQLQDLVRLNVTTANSFLLALLRAWLRNEFQAQEIGDILDAFRIYVLRRRLLGISAGENKNFPHLAKYIPELKEAADKKEKMFEILSGLQSSLRLPNDIELTRNLETMNFFNFAHCKFVLSLIEESLVGTRPDMDDKDLRVERVMPHALNKEWKKALGSDFEIVRHELENVIGNITLIRNKSELASQTFAEKKAVYAEEGELQVAKSWIVDQEIWGRDSICKRTEQIVQYLLTKTLAIPERMRNTNNFSQSQRFRFSFVELDLVGEEIRFKDKPGIKARVVNDTEVEYEGKKWKLSPLTSEVYKRIGKGSPSTGYQGSRYWTHDGVILYDLATEANGGESDSE